MGFDAGGRIAALVGTTADVAELDAAGAGAQPDRPACRQS